MAPCGRLWKKRFELPLDCSKCQVLIFSDSNAWFFYQSWGEAGHFSTWRAALVRYRGAFPSDDSAFWRTFLAQRELGTKNRHCSAATARSHDNSQSDRKASESRWVICTERKVHLKNTPKTFFQRLAHYKRTRVNVAKHTKFSLPSTTRKQTHFDP